MTIRTASIRVPRKFYHDHVERDLPAPGVLRRTKHHYFIDALSPYLEEFLSDAEYYSSMSRYMDAEYRGLCKSAAATVKAIMTEKS
jgi:hypothetical protein